MNPKLGGRPPVETVVRDLVVVVGNASLMAQDFNVVKVDVGDFDRNLDVIAQLGEPTAKGIPAAVLLSPDGKMRYATKASELSNARRMSDEGVHDFFEKLLVNQGG